MKTQYKILWIEDNIHNVRGYKNDLERYLDEHEIKLEIVDIEVTQDEDPTEQQKFKDTVEDIDLDMVFIDYNMSTKGNKIINFIRKDLHHYLPILFYTSLDNAQEELQRSILQINKSEDRADKIADGIYYCDREHISEKARLILNSLLKKESRPQQTRGLLMDRVSEIDANLTECLKRLWEQVPLDKQALVKKELNDRIDSAVTKNSKLLKKLENLSWDEVANFIEENKKEIGTFSKAKVLREILRLIDIYEENGVILSKFYNGTDQEMSLNDLRNKYAHETEKVLIGSHNEELCKYIRKNSRDQLDNLNFLLSKNN
ncbi:MAG: hypothetical protein OXD45_05980 [Rhodobacteraceae bacterium]|nr:hypothetical protein [Paracoccaceae bacterium]